MEQKPRHPYTPSPVLYKGLLHYTQSNQALLSCTEAKTGVTHIDRERLNGLANVYSSLVAADEKVYITARNGATLVLNTAKNLNL